MPELRARPGEWQEYRHDSGETLGFRFVRSARRTIALYVHRDGSVLVRAPLRAPYAEICLFMRERWSWLQQQRSRFLQEPGPRPHVLGDGLPFWHLGKEVMLRVVPAARLRVCEEDGGLLLMLPETQRANPLAVAAAVESWQRRQAQLLFPLRLAHCHELMRELSLPYPQLKIRKMRSRWGSCSRSAVVTLNLDLMRMPLHCIDYVVIHELCHLVEFNHSPRFYELQSRFAPDWKQYRNELEERARR